jgi:hypothetical protein
MDENTQSGCLGCGCLTILLICFLIFIGGSYGIEPHPKPTLTPTPIVSPKPQPPIYSNKWELKVINVEHPGKQLQWSDYGKIEEASGTWLVVHISLKNTALDDSSIHPSNFRIIDSQGKTYDHYKDYTVSETYELYRGGQLIVNKLIKSSNQANCYLLFDIPPDATGLKLDFKPDVFAKSEMIELNDNLGIDN